MKETISILLERLEDSISPATNIISWSSPVPSFGDLNNSEVATLGINPSNREFVDIGGNELSGKKRRLHTLKSLGLDNWAEANDEHLEMIIDSCITYFFRNPYDGWFKVLDNLISGTKASYYNESKKACHLDLVPFATECKWTELNIQQRTLLMELASDTLGLLLRDSPIQLLVLNGKAVVEGLEDISGQTFNIMEIPSWTLSRKSGNDVKGYAYVGIISEISGIKLGREIKVLGFNHNMQSSFGITNSVKSSIRNWIANKSKGIVNESKGCSPI